MKDSRDGGCVSNTPIDGVLHAAPRTDALIFMVDLFDPQGREPQTMDEVYQRQAEIQYASRSTYHIEETTTRRNLRRALQHALEKLPEQDKHDDPVLRNAMAEVDENVHRPQARTEIVRIIAHPAPSDLASQCSEFSRVSIEERTTAGYEDMMRAIALHPWTAGHAAPRRTSQVWVHDGPSLRYDRVPPAVLLSRGAFTRTGSAMVPVQLIVLLSGIALSVLILVIVALRWSRRRTETMRNDYAPPPTWGDVYRDILAEAHTRPKRFRRGDFAHHPGAAVRTLFDRPWDVGGTGEPLGLTPKTKP